MKKILASLTLGILLLPVLAGAQVNPVQPGTGSVPNQSQDVFTVISTIINWLFYILLIAAVFIVIWAAFTFLTAAGDPEKVAKARNLILYAVVAIVVAFLAKAIILLVASAIGVKGRTGI